MVYFIIIYYALLFIIIFLYISFFLDFFLEILQLEKKNYHHNMACMPCNNFSVHSKAVSRFRATWRSEAGTSFLGSSPYLPSSSFFLCIPFRLQPLLSCPEEKPMDRYNKVTTIFQVRKLRLRTLGAAPGCPAGR